MVGSNHVVILEEFPFAFLILLMDGSELAGCRARMGAGVEPVQGIKLAASGVGHGTWESETNKVPVPMVVGSS